MPLAEAMSAADLERTINLGWEQRASLTPRSDGPVPKAVMQAVSLLEAGTPVGWDAWPELVTDQLFRPQRLDHMVITWIGNVWLYLFAIAIAAPLLVQRPANAPRVPAIWWIVMLVALALLLTFTTKTRGGEGNYFVLPVALAILASGALAIGGLAPGMAKRLVLAMLPFFVVSQAFYSFISAS